jgi:quercetin dioxygenase-like cupin family protein
MRLRFVFCCALLCCFVAAIAFAQDAVRVDPKHYKVVSENAQVRILRVHYGPHEKSVMHSHPDSVVVYLSNGTTKFTFPDGKTRDSTGKKGESQFTPAETHLPENTGDTPFDAVVIELKGGK